MNKTNMQDFELERALRQQFHERYGDPPPVATLWANLSARLSARLAAREQRPARRSGLLVRTLAFPSHSWGRLSLRQSIALGLLLLVIVGAATYSASVLLHPLLQVPAAQGRMYTRVSQTRTLGDVTITVEQAVADREGIIIGVSAERPCVIPTDACSFDLAAPVLTVQNGQGVKPNAILSDSAYQPGKQEAAYVFFFKPPQLNGQPATLDLHLELRLLDHHGEPADETAIFDFTLPNHVSASS